MTKQEKELNLRKQMGDKAYYKKKLEDDRMTLKILRIIGIMLCIFTVIIVAISIAVQQYYFTLGWSITSIVLLICGVLEWQKIARRRQTYLDAYSKNEIKKQKPLTIEEKLPADTKVIKPKK